MTKHQRQIFATLVFLSLFLLGHAAIAEAVDSRNCRALVEDLNLGWQASGLYYSPKPGAPPIQSRQGKWYTPTSIDYMHQQLNLANRLCQNGNEQESMLRMDLVRKWLRLPEVKHPEEHLRASDHNTANKP